MILKVVLFSVLVSVSVADPGSFTGSASVNNLLNIVFSKLGSYGKFS